MDLTARWMLDGCCGGRAIASEVAVYFDRIMTL